MTSPTETHATITICSRCGSNCHEWRQDGRCWTDAENNDNGPTLEELWAQRAEKATDNIVATFLGKTPLEPEARAALLEAVKRNLAPPVVLPANKPPEHFGKGLYRTVSGEVLGEIANTLEDLDHVNMIVRDSLTLPFKTREQIASLGMCMRGHLNTAAAKYISEKEQSKKGSNLPKDWWP